MSLILLNLQSNQLIKLDSENPLIIGRGNVEGCFDKRVSRNHGRVTRTVDGKIRLEALHCNPCFFTRNGVPPVCQLNKNEEETLNEGDYLGLLPNAFWFKITTDRDKKIKTEVVDNARTDVDCEENVRTKVSEENGNASNSLVNETVVNRDAQYTSGDIQNKNNVNPTQLPSSNCESTLSGPSRGYGSAEFEKTRRLPLWMYEIDEPINTDKSPSKRSRSNNNHGSKKKQKVSPETEIKKEPLIKSEDGIKVEGEDNLLNVPSTSRTHDIDESPNPTPESQSEQQNIAQGQSESTKDCNKKEGYESEVNNTECCASRPICQYEGNCYRKNPQHKLEFCHPGDPDYIPYEERPLCQFGAACYRRNEKHRVEFRHPTPGSTSQNISSSSSSRASRASSPLPAKRRRKKVVTGNSDYGDDDEYDLEDPFINDASSDEYVPSDSDPEEDEEEEWDASREED